MNAAEDQPEPQLAISESSPTVPQRQPLLMHWPATSAWEAAEGARSQAAGTQDDAFASISSPPPLAIREALEAFSSGWWRTSRRRR